MNTLSQIEIVILLLIAVLALTTTARRLAIPYPILLVVGGLVLGLVPGLPTVRLDPEIVFLVFLPPILWSAAYFTSWRDFRADLRPIALLAVGLVLATTAVVAGAARAMFPGISWAVAIALGAIVSPPDAVSATAVGRQLRLPRRGITILEGESLVNDATALVLYRAALATAVSGTFDVGGALRDFVLAATLGIAIGFAVGIATRWSLRLTVDSFSEIAITLLAPYIAWVVAEKVHASGVLACVAGGLYVRRHFSAVVAPATRIQARAVWDLLVFLLNSILFILIGLQLGALRDAIPLNELPGLTLKGSLVVATVIIVRLVWVPVAAVVPRFLGVARRSRAPPSWSNLFIIGWTGMRGIVSLAAAMALPLATADGAPFPYRAEIILVTFMVILVTLVVQGLSLPLVIRLLKIQDDGGLEHEERQARERAVMAALARLDEVVGEDWTVPDHIEQLRLHYGSRQQRHLGPGDEAATCSREVAEAFRRLRHETLTAERLALIDLRNEGVISDEILHHLEHELDIEAVRLGVGQLRVYPSGRRRH